MGGPPTVATRSTQQPARRPPAPPSDHLPTQPVTGSALIHLLLTHPTTHLFVVEIKSFSPFQSPRKAKPPLPTPVLLTCCRPQAVHLFPGHPGLLPV